MKLIEWLFIDDKIVASKILFIIYIADIRLVNILYAV